MRGKRLIITEARYILTHTNTHTNINKYRLPLLSCQVIFDCFANPWTVACQIPLSMGFPRQEYRNGLPFPPPGALGIFQIQVSNLHLLNCGQILYHLSSPRKQIYTYMYIIICFINKLYSSTTLCIEFSTDVITHLEITLFMINYYIKKAI